MGEDMTTMGVGVFVLRNLRDTPDSPPYPAFLIGKRGKAAKRAPGVWALPGGMREDDETVIECARREVLEETGLEISMSILDDFQTSVIGVSDHYPREPHLTFWVAAHHMSGEPIVKEPDKCDCWEWHTPKWIVENVPQVGEQTYWTPLDAWRHMLFKLGLPTF
jgi:8-oxo-dGTP pyrophosphatase MutT (NUDIX family)